VTQVSSVKEGRDQTKELPKERKALPGVSGDKAEPASRVREDKKEDTDMKRSFLGIGVVASVVTVASVVADESKLPKGWHLSGSHAADYVADVDNKIVRFGRSAGRLASKPDKKEVAGFGALLQDFDATPYKGQRVRMTAYVRAENVKESAGLWLRIDGDAFKPLAFDNMQDRAIKGTKDWAHYEVVLDVDAAKAKAITFGVLLSGTGTVWVDDFKFEIVPLSVPTTDQMKKEARADAKGPVNLGFDD
jgi:hypothetical protein